jgi:hypothetical protein
VPRRGTDYGSLDLAEVTGVVTLDGQPLAEAMVVFESADGTFATGTTDAAGSYEMMYNSEQAGVTKGAKTVRITMRPVASEEALPTGDQPGAGSASTGELIPACYNRNSELRVVIDSDSHTFNFHLTSLPSSSTRSR